MRTGGPDGEQFLNTFRRGERRLSPRRVSLGRRALNQGRSRIAG